jgi:hypothetical protein
MVGNLVIYFISTPIIVGSVASPLLTISCFLSSILKDGLDFGIHDFIIVSPELGYKEEEYLHIAQLLSTTT